MLQADLELLPENGPNRRVARVSVGRLDAGLVPSDGQAYAVAVVELGRDGEPSAGVVGWIAFDGHGALELLGAALDAWRAGALRQLPEDLDAQWRWRTDVGEGVAALAPAP